MRRAARTLLASFAAVFSCIFILYGNHIINSFSNHRLMLPTRLILETNAQHQIDNIGILKEIGREFLPNFKNPCWYESRKDRHEEGKVTDFDGASTKLSVLKHHYERQSDKILRCLPYFFLIGQPKCATTDVFQRINIHPDVVEPIVKGPHWWTRKRYGQPYASQPVTFSEYLDVFNATKIEEGGKRCKEDPHKLCHEKITGDGSTSTLWDSSPSMNYLYRIMSGSMRESISRSLLSRRHVSHSFFDKHSYTEVNTTKTPKSKGYIENLQVIKYPNYYGPEEGVVLPFTVADVIHSILPGSRIIVVIREPVSRLYSSYLFFTKKTSVSPENFDENVKNSIEKWQDCTRQYSERTCAYNKTLQNSLGVRLYNGLYSIFLRDWLEVFQQDQVLVLRMEDYHQNITKTIASIYHHLGLRTLTGEEEKRVNMAPVRNKNWKKPNIGRMLESTEKVIREFYKPYNQDLAILLKDSRFTWHDIYLKNEEQNGG